VASNRWGGALLVAGLVGATVFVAAPAAHADDETIHSYAVTVSVGADGTAHVQEVIDYDFGSNQRHGIYRNIPVRYPYPPDDRYERVLKIDNLHVSSDAPDDVKTSNEGNTFVIRIGDEDTTVSGEHTYTITYDVRGALNAFSEHVELSWNAVGNEWDVPVEQARATVTMPGPVTGTTCFAGYEGSQLSCDDVRTDGSTATFTQGSMGSYQGLTVVVGAPVSAFAAGAAQPILDEKFAVSRAFAPSPGAILGSIAVLVLGIGGVLSLLWRRGRDRVWPGVTPGLDPPAGTAGDVEARRGLFTDPEGAIEWKPPRDLRPAQVGIILDERADVLDISSTVVDLAVRGYLRIEEQERSHWFASRDWKLIRLRTDTDGLLTYESMLLRDLFESGEEVMLSDLKKKFASKLSAIRKAVETDAVQRKWFHARPTVTRAIWGVLGFIAVALGVALTWLLAVFTHAGLVGLAVVAVGATLLFVSGRMPARTAKGSAVFSQVLGFERYLKTAELEQIKYEESVDVLSRYLPYAMVFGETDRWAKALAALAAGQAAAGSTHVSTIGWYSGPSGWDFGSLGSSLGSFAESSGSTFAASAASSGGSAGGGGGGFGGGGGGSW
jgi:hypothetical protein